jgi:Flp pilus assembly protein TadG
MIRLDPSATARRPRRRRDGGDRWRDRGSATLEIAILGPAILALTFTLVQAGLWFYARSLALAAAQEGVTAARAYNATATAGTNRAQAFLAQQAGDSITGAAVAAGTTTTTVQITVTGRALSVLPGVPGPVVSQSAYAERERFTVPGSGP